MAGPIPGITELDAQAVDELYKRLTEAARRVAERRPTPTSPTSLRPVGGLPPASIGRAALGLGTNVPSIISGPVLGAAAGYAISETESAADELNKSLDEYSPTEITNTPEAVAAYLGLPFARGVRYKGPDTVKTKGNPTTAPVTPEPLSPMTAEERALHEATPQFSDEEQDLFFKSLQHEVGQPTSETTTAPPSQGLTARLVNGKIVFGNQGGGDELGYDAGVDRWQAGALESQRPSDPRALGVNELGSRGDFLVRPTPARDPNSQTGFRGGYMPSAEVPRDLPADAEAANTAIEAIPHMGAREMAREQWGMEEALRAEAARRSLAEAEAGARGAEAGLIQARTKELGKDPETRAREAGRARAVESAATETGRYEAGVQFVQSPRGQVEVEQKIAEWKADPRNKAILPKNPKQEEQLRQTVTRQVIEDYASGRLQKIEQENILTKTSGMPVPYQG